jgi:hypothetical protein
MSVPPADGPVLYDPFLALKLLQAQFRLDPFAFRSGLSGDHLARFLGHSQASLGGVITGAGGGGAGLFDNAFILLSCRAPPVIGIAVRSRQQVVAGLLRVPKCGKDRGQLRF